MGTSKKKRKTLEQILKKPVNFNQIKTQTGLTRKQAKLKISEMKVNGAPLNSYVDEKDYQIYFYLDNNPKPIVEAIDLGLNDGNYLFLAKSDTHMGDKAFDLAKLNKVYDIAEDRGVTYITDSGDLSTGTTVYRGQHADLQYHTLDDQIDFIVEQHPNLEGIPMYVCGGNHDYDGLKNYGVNPLKIIDNRRDDINFIGWTDAKLNIGNGVITELVHYKGSMAWSLGYRGQKFLRDCQPYNMPDILLLGHKHVTMYAHIQGVHTFECGTFQGQNNFTKERGLPGEIAAWIIEYTIDNGKLLSIKPELIIP